MDFLTSEEYFGTQTNMDNQCHDHVGQQQTTSVRDTGPLGPNQMAATRKSRTRHWPERSGPHERIPSAVEWIQAHPGFKLVQPGMKGACDKLAIFEDIDETPRLKFNIRCQNGRSKTLWPHFPCVEEQDLKIGTSLEQICQWSPLHCWGDGLRIFMAEGWTAEDIWRQLPTKAKNSGAATRPWNYLQQAMGREADKMYQESGNDKRVPIKRKRAGSSTSVVSGAALASTSDQYSTASVSTDSGFQQPDTDAHHLQLTHTETLSHGEYAVSHQKPVHAQGDSASNLVAHESFASSLLYIPKPNTTAAAENDFVSHVLTTNHDVAGRDFNNTTMNNISHRYPANTQFVQQNADDMSGQAMNMSFHGGSMLQYSTPTYQHGVNMPLHPGQVSQYTSHMLPCGKNQFPRAGNMPMYADDSLSYAEDMLFHAESGFTDVELAELREIQNHFISTVPGYAQRHALMFPELHAVNTVDSPVDLTGDARTPLAQQEMPPKPPQGNTIEPSTEVSHEIQTQVDAQQKKTPVPESTKKASKSINDAHRQSSSSTSPSLPSPGQIARKKRGLGRPRTEKPLKEPLVREEAPPVNPNQKFREDNVIVIQDRIDKKQWDELTNEMLTFWMRPDADYFRERFANNPYLRSQSELLHDDNGFRWAYAKAWISNAGQYQAEETRKAERAAKRQKNREKRYREPERNTDKDVSREEPSRVSSLDARVANWDMAAAEKETVKKVSQQRVAAEAAAIDSTDVTIHRVLDQRSPRQAKAHVSQGNMEATANNDDEDNCRFVVDESPAPGRQMSPLVIME